MADQNDEPQAGQPTPPPAAPAAAAKKKVAGSAYRIAGVGAVSVDGVGVTADKNGILTLTAEQVAVLAGHGYAVEPVAGKPE